MKSPQKRCFYCGRWFPPDSRTASFQKACFRQRCRGQRQKQAQAGWLARNTGHFQGHAHYLQQKKWLSKPGNADYLRRYRASHPDFVAADNRRRTLRRRRQKVLEEGRRLSDMKDAIHRREIHRIQSLSASDMKDAMGIRLDGLLKHLATCPWSWRADMKDEMACAATVP